MPRVIHFEVHADDPERAIVFYSTVLGWHFTKWNGPMDYWVIRTGAHEQPGIDGGLLRRRGAGPTEGQAVNSYVCTVDVPNLDEYLGKATSHGATIALPKMPIPTVGWLAYIKDTEGNILGLMQPDTAAR
jgi:predicted enzyme related to lactoylglutathione lyase